MAKDKAHSEPPAAARRSPWPQGRIWAIALVTFRQAVRAKLWILVPPAVAILVLADLSSQHFDPVFESIPAAVSLSLLVMAILSLMLAIFFATYSLPTEMESKIAYTVMTKPVGRTEVVAGKTLGMSLVILAAVGLVGVGAYIYINIRASGIHALARSRLEEMRPRAAFPADLAALQGVADRGPLQTYRYLMGTTGIPILDVDLGRASRGPSGTQWILGETGAQLQWQFGQAPLREWVAAAPGRIHLSLLMVGASDAPPGPTQVVVALLPLGVPLVRDQSQQGADVPIYEAQFDVPPTGELDIPVSGVGARRVPGVLNCPPEGDLALNLAVVSGGHAVGGSPGSAKIVGPGGKDFVVQAPPRVGQLGVVRRINLAGRAQAPRQTATFQFQDVPAGALGPDDAVIEAAFGLDAWAPAMVSPVAEVTFIRPDGQQRTVSFTPDSHHSTLLAVDKAFWHGGPLQVRVECQTDDDYLGLLPESVRLRQDGGPFLLNFLKAILRVWLFGTVLAALGVLVSTRLGWFVGILVTGGLFTILTVAKGVVMGVLASRPPTPDVLALESRISRIPLPYDLLPDTSVSMGQVMPTSEFLAVFAVAALVVLVLVLIGSFIMRFREVAA